MLRFLFVPALALAFAAHLAAQEFSTVTASQKHFTVCRVNLATQSLDLFLRDESGTPFKSFDALEHWLRSHGRKLTFAMNAGMYERDFSPVGLFVEGGKELNPLNLKKGSGNFFLQPNGVFAITRAGARIVESPAYPSVQESTSLATQSGPMLVTDGHINPAFNPDSQSLLFRNGVCVISSRQVVFVISAEPVSFYEFARLFRDELHCKNALFLDGTISSLYAPGLKRDDRKIDLGPIIATTEAL